VVFVGGGLAALTLAGQLTHLGISDFTILDSSGAIAGQFFQRVNTLEQHVLRSPYDHHPGAEGFKDCELLDFARMHWAHLTHTERREVRMAQAGHRSVVPLDVFEAFCNHTASVHDAGDRLRKARVHKIVPEGQQVTVRTDRGTIRARNVVICTGEQTRRAPDEWFPDGKPFRHVSYWDERLPDVNGPVAVVGAGLSAAHVISNLLGRGHFVDWIIRSEERYQCADVNASFFRAEGRARFDGTPWDERLTTHATHRRASIMFEFQPLLASAESAGDLRVHRGVSVSGLVSNPAGLTINLLDGRKISSAHAVLALGTVPTTGAELMDDHYVNLTNGWPDLDESTLTYRACPSVHLLGAGASMVLGPAARNIDGHRVAAARVANAINRKLSPEIGSGKVQYPGSQS
jgi:cation diffusion facilitator CzcD-associated flavoprotein CzcO